MVGWSDRDATCHLRGKRGIRLPNLTQTTFGFEAEFDNDVSPLASALAEMELSAEDHLHSYHCDCGSCEFGSYQPAFRCQRDSSCGGEVISNILSTNDWDFALGLMTGLQSAAVATDVEPGPLSGFHVHVDRRHLDDTDLGRLTWQFMRYERMLLAHVALASMNATRGFNTSVCDSTRYDTSARENNVLAAVGFPDEDDLTDLGYFMRNNANRHGNLSMRSGHGTVEFRLWNSTRVAWRMEMFCRLSWLFAQPAFVQRLSDNLVVDSFDTFIACVGEFDVNTSALLLRQQRYNLERGMALSA